MIKLHRYFEASGRDIESFFETIAEMDASTELIKVQPSKIKIYAVYNTESEAQELALMLTMGEERIWDNSVVERIVQDFKNRSAKGEITTLKMSPNATMAFVPITRGKLMNHDVSEELLQDLEKESKMIMVIEDKTYIVSPLAFTTLLRRAKLGGDVMNSPGISRAIEIFKSFQWRILEPSERRAQVVCRKIGNARVLLAMHSGKYCYVPQMILKDIYEQFTNGNLGGILGSPICDRWAVNHEISYCYATFPDLAEEVGSVYNKQNVVPGVYIGTSDSGDSSVTVRGYWKVGNGYVSCAENTFKRSHRGEIDIDELVNTAAANLYAKYTLVPEQLMKLLSINITNVDDTLKSVFKQIKMVSVLGKKRTDLLRAHLLDEFSGSSYTAYDIAIAISSLGSVIQGVERTTMEKFEEVAYRAIFANYNQTLTLSP